MKLEEITAGLTKLLEENHYSQGTIEVYTREWRRIKLFLLENYGNTEFDIERGLLYLEKERGLITSYRIGTLSQAETQLFRVVNMLEDYHLHGVLTRRYYASTNPIQLDGTYVELHDTYCKNLENSDLSASTINHYKRISQVFLDYLNQRNVRSIDQISMDTCNGYIKTLASYTFKTVEQQICGLRYFLRYLYSHELIKEDYAARIHMPKVSKAAKIPSTWSEEELVALLSAIDRNGPIGKRDYAMILLALVLGLRASDIKKLRFSNFNWAEKKLSIIQSKTRKPLVLSIPDAVGWAVINYIKNGRPSYFDTDIIFLKHMPPFDAFDDDARLTEVIDRYARKAGIDRRGKKRSGFHSLRHTAASMYLEMETPLPVITEILGHTDSDITAVYLKTDLIKLKECVLEPENMDDE